MSDQIGTASIGLAVDSSGVDAGLNQMEATVTRAARTLSTLGRTGAAAVGDIGTGATTAATNTERATRRIENELQRVTAAASGAARGSREFYESLATTRGADLNRLRPLLDQLDQVRAAQTAAQAAALRSGQAFNTQSQSAAALANNLRSVPAQLTDIVTSIQGGQAPLTVFLQQGGQLRDMFGSAGGAARALGGYLLSLITPLTVGAAAVVALAVAYNQGSKEADAFRKSIILTGNAAGVTTSQLAGLAKQASETAGTQGQNAEVLAQLVGTGKVGADQLLRATTTAVQSQKLLGIAVEDTVKAFADLGKDPLQATLKFNEQYNYLTLATYKQIKALTEQSRTADAAKVAQVAYADAMDSKNKQVSASLGTLEKAWNGTGSAAKKAWDFMLNVGRENTIDDQIATAQKKLDAAKQAFFAFSGGSNTDKTADQEAAQRNLDRLQNIKKVGDLTAQYAAEDAKSRDAAIAFDKDGEQYLTRKLKIEKEIAAARALGEQSAQRGEDPAVVEQRVQDRIKAIRSANADYFNQSIESQIAAVTRLGAVQEEQAKRALIPIQANNDAGLNKAQDQQAAYIKAVSDADEKALIAERSRIQQRLALTASESVSIDGQIAQQQKLADLKGQIAVKDLQIANRRTQTAADLFVLDVKNNHDLAESYDSLYDTRVADVDALTKQLQAQKDENETIGLTVKHLADLTTRRVEEKAVLLENKALILDTIIGREDEAEALRKQATLMRELNTAQIEGARKAADFKAYDEFWKSIDSAAQSAFSHIGEGGKSVLDRLRDSLKSGLLDLLYQLTVKQFIINIKASVSSDGFGALAGAFSGSGSAGAGSGGAAGTASLISAGKSIYDGFSAGFAGSAGALGGAVSSLGTLFGSEAIAGFGAGLKGYSLGSSTASAGSGYAGTQSAAAGAASGPAITAAAGIAAGVIGGNLLSGGYSAFGGSGHSAVNTGTAVGAVVGSIVPVIGTALGALVGGLIGGAANRLFGYKSPEITAQGVRGTLTDTSVTGQSYTDILQKGGLFRSDKRSTETADLTSDFKNSLISGFTSIKTITESLGKNLQLDVKGLADYSKQFDIKLDPKDGTKSTQAITDFFTTISDELATKLIPNIADFAKVGEKAGGTLERLSADFNATNSIATLLGKTATEAFGAAGLSSIKAREQFIDLSGGIDALSAKLTSYAQNYLTQAEQQKPLVESLGKAFADLNLAVPTTRDGFKALVDGLDLTDASQVKTFNSLMALQEAFAATTPQIDKAAQRQLDIQLMEALGDAEGALSEKRKDALDALVGDQAKATQSEIYAAQDKNAQRQLDIQLMEALGNSEGALAAKRKDALESMLTDQARITQAQIYAAQDAKKIYDDLAEAGDSALSRLTASIDSQRNDINKYYEEQSQIISAATKEALDGAQKSLTAAQTQVSALESIFSTLDSALSSTKSTSDDAAASRRQAAQSVLYLNAANPTNLTDNKALTAAISEISNKSNGRLFDTFEENARDQARTSNALTTLRDAAGVQVDYAKETVSALNESIEAIKKSGDDQIAQLKADTAARLDKLDQTLAIAKSQLETLKGIDNSIISLKDAMAVFANAVLQLQNNPTGSANSQATGVELLYETLLGRQGDSGGLKFFQDALKSGSTLDQVADLIKQSDEYKNLHHFAVGANRIPKDMPAYLHEDEAVIPAADNRQLLALMARATDPEQNNKVLLDEMKRRNDLLEDQNRILGRIDESSGTSADVLKRAQQGQPLATIGI